MAKDAPITGARNRATSTSQPSGRDLIQEGHAMLATLIPNPAARAAAAPRIKRKAHALMPRDVGFFLYGLACAAEGRRHA
jgi:hypothetical protein